MREEKEAILKIVDIVGRIIAWDMHLGEHNKISLLDKLEDIKKLLKNQKGDE